MYIVLEIQKDFEEQISVLANQFETSLQAENKYHTVLAYAAISKLASHAAILMDEYGNLIKKEFYVHEPEE